MNPPRSHPSLICSYIILFCLDWRLIHLLQDGHANLWSLIVLMRMPSLGATSTYRKRKSNQSSACPLFSTTPWRCHFSPSFLLLSLFVPTASLAHSYLYYSQGIMYLENNLCEGMYTQNRVDLLTVLTSQACYPCLYSFLCFFFLLYV